MNPQAMNVVLFCASAVVFLAGVLIGYGWGKDRGARGVWTELFFVQNSVLSQYEAEEDGAHVLTGDFF